MDPTLIRRHLLQALCALAATALALGCATRAVDVPAAPVPTEAFADWDCDRLFDEIDRVHLRAVDVAYAVDARVGDNMIALGVGATLFWPALLAMRADGPEARELSQLKGRQDALQRAAAQRGCGSAPATMSSRRAAALPLAIGERFVYQLRRSASAPPRELGFRVLALRRDGIDFVVDQAGTAMPGLWQQDLAGNPVLAGRTPLPAWSRLLRRDLQLGQLLAGELHTADDRGPPAHLRGHVVSLALQTIAGREFDVAVIELGGDATLGEQGSTRLQGVMAIDRRSGLLLRLEVQCANAAFAVYQRLSRIEPAQP